MIKKSICIGSAQENKAFKSDFFRPVFGIRSLEMPRTLDNS